MTCNSLNVEGMVPRSALLRELRNLGPHKMLVLHAVAQNCALLIYQNDVYVLFASYLSSILTVKVNLMNAKSSLKRSKPQRHAIRYWRPKMHSCGTFLVAP